MSEFVLRPAVTVASVVEHDGRYLLVEEETRAGLRLNQPAGHVESGESIVAAATRETLEEAAWQVEPTALIGIYQWKAPDNGLTYIRFTVAALPRLHEPSRALDRGIVRALWLTYAEIAACRERHRSPLLLRSIDDYLSGRRWPLDLISAL